MSLATAVLAASNPIDLAAWERLLAEHVHLRIANRPVQLHRAGVVEELSAMFAGVHSLGQGFRAIWPGRDRETLLMELDLIPFAGRTLPFALVLRCLPDAPLIQDMRFYADLSPLRLAGLTDVAMQ